MTTSHEASQERRGPPLKEIDAAKVLSNWYGQDSIACHKLRIYQDGTAESEFIVGQNLCGPDSRPPMFDRLRLRNGVFTTRTSPEDAKEHFIEPVGIQVIPGHNMTGLVAEAFTQEFYQSREQKGTLYVVGFDFMRFKDFVIPGQELSFVGSTTKTDKEIVGPMTMQGQSRPFTRNFRCEEGEMLDEDVQKKVLDQHWIFEVNAQGLGVMSLQQAPKDVVPVLMESGSSSFAKVPILAGDIATSRFTLKAVDEKQVLGNAMTFVKDQQVAEQKDILLQLVPIQTLKDAVEAAKQKM
ncbi:MAG: hypothetical protein A3D74_03865 [Candidatus Levybacteria bacterium RIFCSPHIGHO2_02_FULL_37_13]|nr:MAG: hypothetical protein A3D74_03865 [Candidatus Levybacteria bacterium RIFCSPHIGHO2_02_FULL_37_13]OGH30445.1 MAG: hypothetical protein A3E40_05390 [Candidatus Levybacteria bacterium RIFCSPHIGHO2_12_FULL_37_9]